MIELFSRNHTIGGFLIRLFTRSYWSHCAILTPDKTVIEAVFLHGVREIPFAEWTSNKSRFCAVPRDIPRPDDAIAFARSQIGKPYDVKGVLGGLFDRQWSRPDRWYCSELNESSASAGGKPTFNPATCKAVSPKDRWRII